MESWRSSGGRVSPGVDGGALGVVQVAGRRPPGRGSESDQSSVGVLLVGYADVQEFNIIARECWTRKSARHLKVQSERTRENVILVCG